MSKANTILQAPGEVASRASFEALTPHRSPLFLGLIGLLIVVLGTAAWVVPPLQHPGLQGDSFWAKGVIPAGWQVNLIASSLDIDARGGITISQAQPVGTARLVGTWVLDETQAARYSTAASDWTSSCLDDSNNSIGSDGELCQLPTGDAQAMALVDHLVQLGAPLDETTAAPRHLSNGTTGAIVTLWLATQCDNENASYMGVQTERFGLTGQASVGLGQWPGCWFTQ